MVEALFYAFFVGTGLGFLYDLMRFFRLSFGGSLFFDLLFWLITSFVSFSYLLIFNDGAIKGIFLAFIFVGFTVYIISMGKISLPLEKRIAKKVKIRLKKVKKSLENFKKVLQLPRMLYYNFKEIIISLCRKGKAAKLIVYIFVNCLFVPCKPIIRSSVRRKRFII